MTTLPRGAVPPIPPIMQRAADKAVQIAEDWTGRTSNPPPPPPPSSGTLFTPQSARKPQPPVAYTRGQVTVAAKTDPLLGFMTTLIMKKGLLNRARKIVAETLLYIQSQTHSDPLPFVKEAIRRASPSVRLASHKRGANILPVPIPLFERQRTRTGFMWILESCRTRNEKGLHRKIAWEMMDLINGKSTILQKKQKLHQDAARERSNAMFGSRNH